MLVLLRVFIDTLSDVGPSPSIYIDLLNMAWWQTLLAILAGLGLSPAPWILGLATGKIQFSAAAEKEKNRALEAQKEFYEARLSERDVNHAALVAMQNERYAEIYKSNEANAHAAETERGRANQATDALTEAADVIKAAVHYMASVDEVAREATSK